MVCYYWFFNHGFKFQDSVCNGCHDLTMLWPNFSDIDVITVKNIDYCCIMYSISKSDAIHYNILIDEKNYKDLTIYFTRYVHKRSIKMLSLHYHELMGKIEEHEGKKLMVDDYMMNKALDKVKEIILRFADTKILIDTDDKLPDDITFKNVVVLMTCVIKDDGKLYPQIFLEEAFYV